MSSPLFDTLFRPTTASPSVASAAPVRVTGTRTRAGNAMNRTRAALLEGAARAVAVSGTKITMAQVATAAGVAKATLYNHFRTREAVLTALLTAQVDQIIEEHAGKPLARALVDCAVAVSNHPVARGLAQVEPATLAAVARIDRTSDGWGRARAALDSALAAEGRAGTDLVLRWIGSHLLSPADADEVAAESAILLAALPETPTGAPATAGDALSA